MHDLLYGSKGSSELGCWVGGEFLVFHFFSGFHRKSRKKAYMCQPLGLPPSASRDGSKMGLSVKDHHSEGFQLTIERSRPEKSPARVEASR